MKQLETLSGMVIAMGTMAWSRDFALAMLTAFFGGVVAYIAKRVCEQIHAAWRRKKIVKLKPKDDGDNS